MKKLIAFLCSAFLLLSPCSCSGEQALAEDAAAGFGGDLLAKAQQKAAEKEADEHGVPGIELAHAQAVTDGDRKGVHRQADADQDHFHKLHHGPYPPQF